MRQLLISLACVSLLPTVSSGQEKALPSASEFLPATVSSLCDGYPGQVLFNCG